MTSRRAPKLTCPHCQYWDSQVIDTRGRPDYIWRVRVCKDCGCRFATHETVENIIALPEQRTA